MIVMNDRLSGMKDIVEIKKEIATQSLLEINKQVLTLFKKAFSSDWTQQQSQPPPRSSVTDEYHQKLPSSNLFINSRRDSDEDANDPHTRNNSQFDNFPTVFASKAIVQSRIDPFLAAGKMTFGENNQTVNKEDQVNKQTVGTILAAFSKERAQDSQNDSFEIEEQKEDVQIHAVQIDNDLKLKNETDQIQTVIQAPLQILKEELEIQPPAIDIISPSPVKVKTKISESSNPWNDVSLPAIDNGNIDSKPTDDFFKSVSKSQQKEDNSNDFFNFSDQPKIEVFMLKEDYKIVAEKPSDGKQLKDTNIKDKFQQPTNNAEVQLATPTESDSSRGVNFKKKNQKSFTQAETFEGLFKDQQQQPQAETPELLKDGDLITENDNVEKCSQELEQDKQNYDIDKVWDHFGDFAKDEVKEHNPKKLVEAIHIVPRQVAQAANTRLAAESGSSVQDPFGQYLETASPSIKTKSESAIDFFNFEDQTKIQSQVQVVPRLTSLNSGISTELHTIKEEVESQAVTSQNQVQLVHSPSYFSLREQNDIAHDSMAHFQQKLIAKYEQQADDLSSLSLSKTIQVAESTTTVANTMMLPNQSIGVVVQRREELEKIKPDADNFNEIKQTGSRLNEQEASNDRKKYQKKKEMKFENLIKEVARENETVFEQQVNSPIQGSFLTSESKQIQDIKDKLPEFNSHLQMQSESSQRLDVANTSSYSLPMFDAFDQIEVETPKMNKRFILPGQTEAPPEITTTIVIGAFKAGPQITIDELDNIQEHDVVKLTKDVMKTPIDTRKVEANIVFDMIEAQVEAHELGLDQNIAFSQQKIANDGYINQNPITVNVFEEKDFLELSVTESANIRDQQTPLGESYFDAFEQFSRDYDISMHSSAGKLEILAEGKNEMILSPQQLSGNKNPDADMFL